MNRRTRRIAGALALAATGSLAAAVAIGHEGLTSAGTANIRAAGMAPPDKLSPQLRQVTVAQGSNAVENPSALVAAYGYFNDGPMLPAPGDVQSPTHNVEATKSEPDK